MNIGTLDGRGFDINAILFALQNVTVEMLSWKCSRDVLENNLKNPQMFFCAASFMNPGLNNYLNSYVSVIAALRNYWHNKSVTLISNDDLYNQ